jgi:hypothetical protein
MYKICLSKQTLLSAGFKNDVNICDTVIFASNDENLTYGIIEYLEEKACEPLFKKIMAPMTHNARNLHVVKYGGFIFDVIHSMYSSVYIDENMTDKIFIDGIINAKKYDDQPNINYESLLLCEIRTYFENQNII